MWRRRRGRIKGNSRSVKLYSSEQTTYGTLSGLFSGLDSDCMRKVQQEVQRRKKETSYGHSSLYHDAAAAAAVSDALSRISGSFHHLQFPPVTKIPPCPLIVSPAIYCSILHPRRSCLPDLLFVRILCTKSDLVLLDVVSLPAASSSPYSVGRHTIHLVCQHLPTRVILLQRGCCSRQAKIAVFRG